VSHVRSLKLGCRVRPRNLRLDQHWTAPQEARFGAHCRIQSLAVLSCLEFAMAAASLGALTGHKGVPAHRLGREGIVLCRYPCETFILAASTGLQQSHWT